MKNRFLLSMIALGLLGVAGCATQQSPAPDAPAAAAAPQFTTPPPEVRANLVFSGVQVQIYHPQTRTLYMWVGSPRPDAKQVMTCFKLQLSDTPSGTPQREKCE
jgi:hypothetical protein